MQAEEKEYCVDLLALAQVKASLYIKASSQAAAEAKALAQTGDVTWSYQGVEESTVEAHAKEHVSDFVVPDCARIGFDPMQDSCSCPAHVTNS